MLPIDLKLNGKASWETELHKIQQSIKEVSPHNRTWGACDIVPRDSDAPTYFRCPKCPHAECNTCSNFQRVDFDILQKCNLCQKATSVRLWKCSCNAYWHNCPTHRAYHNNHAVKHKKKSIPEITDFNTSSVSQQSKRGRMLASMTQEQLRQEDCTRAKRKREESDELGLQPTFVLGHARTKTIKIASLPPVLKKRFIHPGGE